MLIPEKSPDAFKNIGAFLFLRNDCCWCRFVTCTVTFQFIPTLSNVPVGVTNPDRLGGEQSEKL
jgi:hypothetical protein